jgi:flagellin-like protein
MIVPRRKGISPVIATVIIVAVTIAVAIAVAFWMTGIIGLFTGAVEKVEFVTLYATPKTDSSGWTLTAIVRNVGTTSTSIDSIFINGVLAGTVSGTTVKKDSTTLTCLSNIEFDTSSKNPMMPGQNATVVITLNKGDCGVFQAQPGVSIEVKLHTTGGKEYPKLIVLP